MENDTGLEIILYCNDFMKLLDKIKEGSIIYIMKQKRR
jgi:hypothetical protein